MYLEPPLNLSDCDPALDWFCDLIRHLGDLEFGIVPPMLDCAVRSKRLPTVEWMKRVWVVRAIELLHATGMKYEAAARGAIIGYQLRGVSEKEALSWRKEFQKRKVRNEEAMQVYEDNMAWLRKKVREKDIEAPRQDVAMLHDNWAARARTARELPLLRGAFESKLKATLGPVPKRGE
jgi:hypothetical protein